MMREAFLAPDHVLRFICLCLCSRRYDLRRSADEMVTAASYKSTCRFASADSTIASHTSAAR